MGGESQPLCELPINGRARHRSMLARLEYRERDRLSHTAHLTSVFRTVSLIDLTPPTFIRPDMHLEIQHFACR